MNTIIYYDLASEYYLAYPLCGLMAEAPKYGCRIRVSKQPPSLFSGLPLTERDTSRLFALGIFRVITEKGSRWFCVDAHDDSGPDGYFRTVLNRVDYYFKLNLNPAAFAQTPTLARLRRKVESLACTFAVRPPKPWLFLPRLTACPAYAWNWLSVKRRLRALQRIPDFRWHAALREERPEHDVSFVRRYYREPEHAASNELYCRIFDSMKALNGVSGTLGFTGLAPDVPERFRRHACGGERPYRDHLREAARSRVGLYAPGTYNCLSFKFGQYLALGKPVVGLKLPFEPAPEMDGADKALLEEQFCCREPEEIPAKVAELLRDPARQERLRAGNLRVFERYFSPRAVANRILSRVL